MPGCLHGSGRHQRQAGPTAAPQPGRTPASQSAGSSILGEKRKQNEYTVKPEFSKHKNIPFQTRGILIKVKSNAESSCWSFLHCF